MRSQQIVASVKSRARITDNSCQWLGHHWRGARSACRRREAERVRSSAIPPRIGCECPNNGLSPITRSRDKARRISRTSVGCHRMAWMRLRASWRETRVSLFCLRRGCEGVEGAHFSDLGQLFACAKFRGALGGPDEIHSLAGSRTTSLRHSLFLLFSAILLCAVCGHG